MKLNVGSIIGILILILCIVGGIYFPDIVFLFIFLSIIGLVILILANQDFITDLYLKPKNQVNFFHTFIEKISGLTPSSEELLNAKNKLFTKKYNIWDPVEKLNLEEIKKNAAAIEIKIESLKNDPGQINRQLTIIFMLGFLVFSTFVYFFYIFHLLGTADGFKLLFYILILFFSMFFAIKTYYLLLTKDLLKLEIAKKKEWIYNPDHDKDKLEKLTLYFPETFSKGNQNQYIEDQFWGLVENNSKSNFFYSGVYYYEIVTGYGKNRRVTKYTNHYFIFPLKKDINARFHLFPENAQSIISNWFTKKEINVESNEFNKRFAFTYNGKKDEKALEIVRTLTPVMQEKLIKLYRQKGSCEILFARNTVVFLFNKDIINEIKTDFRKSSEINLDDLNQIDTKLNELITISEEMSKYLD